MWKEIFKFEIIYRLKRPDTYLFFVFLLLFSIVGVDFVFQGVDLGLIKKNAPLIIAKTMGAITGIFMILASMIMGVSVLRDFQYQIESLLFVNPIKKRNYLLGRFLGSFVVLLFVFSGVFFGIMLGELMPWHAEDAFMPFQFMSYLKPFLVVILPILFFGAALFFVSGALSKKLVVVYTQGIILFVVFMLTKAISNDTLQAMLDPFSLTTLTQVTESWSVTERNLENIPFSGLMLYNKLFWVVLGVIILVFGYHKFNFGAVSSKRSKKQNFQELEAQTDALDDSEIPPFYWQAGLKAKWKQFTHFSWFYFVSICKQPTFWAIMICGMIIILINSVNLGTVYGVDSYPTTYFIVEEFQETSIYFFIIILIFYSGELIWKERTASINLIYDATAMSSFVNLAGKYMGLIGIYITLIISLIVSGIIFQTMNGYYHYDFQVYFYGFFVEILPYLALYTFVAFFIQVLVNQKFVGILLLLVFFILNIALGLFGFDHDLYFFGGNGLEKYSEMNGYGHFLKPYLLVKSYWVVFGVLLLLIASVMSVRGTETNFINRWKASKHRWSPFLKKMGIVAILAFVLLGSYIFYNMNILNTYWTHSEQIAFRVNYEQVLKPLEYIDQPKIVSVNLKVELYPKNRAYGVDGVYILKNTHDTPITEIHIQKLIATGVVLDSVSFEGGAVPNKQYDKFEYIIYKLNKALNSGDSIEMKFKQTYTPQGFEQGGSDTKMVHNGTFLNNSILPTLGYNKKYELTDVSDRTAHDLTKRANKAMREDAKELVNSRSGSDSDGTRFEIVIGTSENQTTIAPGNLIKKWKVNNRNYFHYKMENPIIDFYAITSAEYEVKKDVWLSKSDSSSNPVDLEIYYRKTHDYNLDRMMEGMKTSFDYFSTNFSPYQYEQLRIVEVPRYVEFAQSFPGTVPFSEAIGFVLNINDKKDVDMAFYVTAHELAHQWFGMQVEAANVQGKLMILETLSQYAALMVLQQKYGEEKVQQFLLQYH